MQASNRGIRAAVAAAVTAVALALGVTACGGDESGSSSGAVKGQTIEYWASNQGATIDQDKQVINEAIARFKKETRRDREVQGHPVGRPVEQHHHGDHVRQGPRRPQHRQHVVRLAAGDRRLHAV